MDQMKLQCSIINHIYINKANSQIPSDPVSFYFDYSKMGKYQVHPTELCTKQTTCINFALT